MMAKPYCKECRKQGIITFMQITPLGNLLCRKCNTLIKGELDIWLSKK